MWIISGIGHFTAYFIGTLNMLIAMTFNIYLILSLCLGSAVGKLFVMRIKVKQKM